MSMYDAYIENRSYYSDHRVRAGQRRKDSPILRIDEDRMVAFVTDCEDDPGEGGVRVPIHFEVCETCSGKGTHVNPSIDSGGLSADDFAEDPDFAESYFAGHYDVPCYECNGQRVVPVIDWPEEGPLAEVQKRLEEREKSLADMRATERAERMMGA
jgi:hypothetical protein